MHYLVLALYSEGPTDYRFLSKVLYRSTHTLCMSRGRSLVEVSEEVLALDAPEEYRGGRREVRILEAAREAVDSFHLLFVHADANGDEQRAREGRIQPAEELIRRELGHSGISTVAVVPVRETEAWVLADRDALSLALGGSLENPLLDIPDRPQEVEAITDPKKRLNEVFRAVQHGRLSTRRRRGRSLGNYLGVLGELVSLERLGGVPAFQRFQTDLELHWIILGFFVRTKAC